jgi:hypothetical protein
LTSWGDRAIAQPMLRSSCVSVSNFLFSPAPATAPAIGEILIMALLVTNNNTNDGATDTTQYCARFVPVGGTNKNAHRKPVIHSNLRRASETKTERTGFEPADQFDPVTALAKPRYRPLSHLSG